MVDILVPQFQIGLALYATAYRSVTKKLTYMRALQLLKTALMQFCPHLSVRTLSLTSTTFCNMKKIHLRFRSNLRLQHSYAEIKQIKRRTVQFALLCSAQFARSRIFHENICNINSLNPELNPICYLLALLGAHHFLHVSRIRVKLLTFRLLMSYIYIWSIHSWCF